MIFQKLITEILATHRCHTYELTPGIWKHNINLVVFCIEVDTFGVKYVGKEHVTHLVNLFQQYYTTDIDWEGNIYCGLPLDWDYKK